MSVCGGGGEAVGGPRGVNAFTSVSVLVVVNASVSASL